MTSTRFARTLALAPLLAAALAARADALNARRAASLARIVSLIALIVASLAMPSEARAQLPAPPNPYVEIQPRGRTIYSADDSVAFPVTIEWCSRIDHTVEPDSTVVMLTSGGITTNVTSLFPPSAWEPSYPFQEWQCESAKKVSGTIMLPHGVSTLWVQVKAYGPSQMWLSDQDQVTFSRPPLPRGVAVSVDAAYESAPASSTRSRTFRIANTGGDADIFSYSYLCSGAAICTAGSGMVSLAAGANTTVTATHTLSNTVGDTGLVQLTATATGSTISDVAWTDVVVRATAAPGVVLPNVVAAGTMARPRCVTIAAGDGAASECGDLRLSHPLPPVRTFGTVRAPMLIYNSGAVQPVTWLAADITLPAGTLPDSVRVTATVTGGATASWAWPGSQWDAATVSTRRVSLPIPGAGVVNTTRRVIVAVSTVVGATATPFDTDTAKVPFTDDGGSNLGAGWKLAGLEQLSWAGTDTLRWFSGDGSTRLYPKTAVVSGTSIFVASPKTDRPDTMTMVIESGASVYYRHLADGGRVRFDDLGRHRRTIDRFGRETLFEHTGVRLDSITVPTPAGAPALRYRFTYGGASFLTSVTAPGPGGTTRTVTITPTSGNAARIGTITDPDGSTVTFGYHPTATLRITSRTDRRGVTRTFGYDALGRLALDSLNPGSGAPPIVTRVRSVEVMGAPGGSYAAAQPLDSVFARLDGPRLDSTDVTQVWVNALGLPERIRNAHGRETQVTYDATWPALAVRTRDPNRLVTRAFYSATRALLDSVTVYNPNGDGLNATTRYRWHLKVRGVNRIISPMWDSTYFDVDSLNGNRTMMRPALDNSRRVDFRYYTSGLFKGMPSAVWSPTGKDSMWYDAARGNPSRTQSPRGGRTYTLTDGIGRDTLSAAAIDEADKADSVAIFVGTFGSGPRGQRTRTGYTAAGLVAFTTTYGPSRTAGYGTVPADSVRVEHAYDREGNDTLTRRIYRRNAGQQADTLRTYASFDSAGRLATYLSPSMNGQETYNYDAAGNRTAHTTPRGHMTVMTYDALNRLVRRVTPLVYYPVDACLKPGTWTFCSVYFPTLTVGGSMVGADSSSNVCIPPDTATFAYDAGGRMTTADNGAARLRRTYLPAGALSTDQMTLRTYYASWTDDCRGTAPTDVAPQPGTEWTTHIHTLTRRYDLAGKLVGITHPATLRPSGAVEQTYQYERNTGWLLGVRGISGDTVAFAYDLDGRRTGAFYPGGALGTWTYDADGRVIAHSASGTDATITSDLPEYDALGRVIGGPAQVTYGPLGAVLRTVGLTPASSGSSEDFKVDGLGNREWKQALNVYQSDPNDRNGERVLAYTREKLDSVAKPGNSGSHYYGQRFRYDVAGNTEASYEAITKLEGGSTLDQSRYYYAGDDKLWATNRHVGVTLPGAAGSLWEEYRYDALGRRVMVKTRQTASSGACTPPACVSSETRVVWDGDQLLYEQKVLESAGVYGWEGGTVAYTHAAGIDAPVLVTKDGTTLAPHADWQGRYVGGTMMNGQVCAPPACWDVDWPGVYQATDGAHVALRGAGSGETGVWLGSLLTQTVDGSELKYSRNRYYDPKTGRFTQEDPIGLGGGLNAYGFAAGDPVNYKDPFGLRECNYSTGEGCSDEFKRVIRQDKPLETPLVDPVSLASGAAQAGIAKAVAARRVLDLSEWRKDH